MTSLEHLIVCPKRRENALTIDGQELSNLSKTDSLQISHSQGDHGYHRWSIIKDTPS